VKISEKSCPLMEQPTNESLDKLHCNYKEPLKVIKKKLSRQITLAVGFEKNDQGTYFK
jgi:hypothetical protein